MVPLGWLHRLRSRSKPLVLGRPFSSGRNTQFPVMVSSAICNVVSQQFLALCDSHSTQSVSEAPESVQPPYLFPASFPIASYRPVATVTGSRAP